MTRKWRGWGSDSNWGAWSELGCRRDKACLVSTIPNRTDHLSSFSRYEWYNSWFYRIPLYPGLYDRGTGIASQRTDYFYYNILRQQIWKNQPLPISCSFPGCEIENVALVGHLGCVVETRHALSLQIRVLNQNNSMNMIRHYNRFVYIKKGKMVANVHPACGAILTNLRQLHFWILDFSKKNVDGWLYK